MNDILSKTTRNARKVLLLISSISILLSYLGLKINKITFLGSESTIQFSERIPIVFIVTILYFLLYFVYYVRTDYKYWQNKSELKIFEDEINVHISGVNDGDKKSTWEAIKGITDRDGYKKGVLKIEKSTSIKFWIDFIVAISISVIALVILIINI